MTKEEVMNVYLEEAMNTHKLNEKEKELFRAVVKKQREDIKKHFEEFIMTNKIEKHYDA